MNRLQPAFIVPIFLGIGIGLRLISGHFDRARIREHVESSGGGKVIEITWNPFGKGWFGSRDERIYDVRYRSKQGKIIEATCKTSLLSGVYWTSHSAPSDFMEPSDSRAELPAGATECLACGATIGPKKTRCPKCGWSYKEV